MTIACAAGRPCRSRQRGNWCAPAWAGGWRWKNSGELPPERMEVQCKKSVWTGVCTAPRIGARISGDLPAFCVAVPEPVTPPRGGGRFVWSISERGKCRAHSKASGSSI